MHSVPKYTTRDSHTQTYTKAHTQAMDESICTLITFRFTEAARTVNSGIDFSVSIKYIHNSFTF